jgi:hypothetical protein
VGTESVKQKALSLVGREAVGQTSVQQGRTGPGCAKGQTGGIGERDPQCLPLWEGRRGAGLRTTIRAKMELEHSFGARLPHPPTSVIVVTA